MMAYKITLEECGQMMAELTKETEQLKKKLIAAEKIFSHFGGLSELSKWENGQGETAVDVVQEYLKL